MNTRPLQSHLSHGACVRLGVITPTFNRPELLARLHRSLCDGNGSVWWKHYVTNDGSSADYVSALLQCKEMSGRIVFDTIQNSGPLVARDVAIERAIEDGVTHLVFADDDGFFFTGALATIERRIFESGHAGWLMFPSQLGGGLLDGWPHNGEQFDWFDDVVLGRRLGSDNLCVLSMTVVGSDRFSTWGRSQREWKFFCKIYRRQKTLMVFEDVLLKHDYEPGGLTDVARSRVSSVIQIVNSVDRAFSYWRIRPWSSQLAFALIRQILLAPVKMVRRMLSPLFVRRSLRP